MPGYWGKGAQDPADFSTVWELVLTEFLLIFDYAVECSLCSMPEKVGQKSQYLLVLGVKTTSPHQPDRRHPLVQKLAWSLTELSLIDQIYIHISLLLGAIVLIGMKYEL